MSVFGEVWQDDSDSEIVMMIDEENLVILQSGEGAGEGDFAGQVRTRSIWANPYGASSEKSRWEQIE